MNLLDLVYLGIDCSDQNIATIMGIIGYVVWGIKVIVPIILIIIGMIDMAKAVTEKSDDKIKAAQTSLVKKAIAAIIVFLVPTLVGLVMGLVSATNWKPCMDCVNSPGKDITINGAAVTCGVVETNN